MLIFIEYKVVFTFYRIQAYINCCINISRYKRRLVSGNIVFPILDFIQSLLIALWVKNLYYLPNNKDIIYYYPVGWFVQSHLACYDRACVQSYWSLTIL